MYRLVCTILNWHKLFEDLPILQWLCFNSRSEGELSQTGQGSELRVEFCHLVLSLTLFSISSTSTWLLLPQEVFPAVWPLQEEPPGCEEGFWDPGQRCQWFYWGGRTQVSLQTTDFLLCPGSDGSEFCCLPYDSHLWTKTHENERSKIQVSWTLMRCYKPVLL